MRLHPDCEGECQVAAARGSLYSCQLAGRDCAQQECDEDAALRRAERMGLTEKTEDSDGNL